MNWAQVLLRGAVAIGGLATFTVGLLYALQEKIIYVPVIPGVPRGYIALPEEYGLDYEDIWIRSKDGIKLHAWLMWRKGLDSEQVKALPLVVFFQENAGNMSMRLHFLRALVAVLNCKVFILSYRGYGESEGSPSEGGLQMDASAAMSYLASRDDHLPDKTVIMGRSLGGAVAIYTAVQHKKDIAGVIVENTFTSIMDMAPQALPPLRPFVGEGKPCNWLVRNKWESIRRITSLKDTPMLFLVSLADEIVHPGQMTRLFGVHGTEPWSLCEFEDAAHMDCYHTHAPLYWPRVKTFFDELVMA
ncbi:hypothetical protein M9435_005665 [Picochlorum sp. BPE23]|nr:hypothetical protein M9435_005665 [Picochlorum sp. BPE23]